MIRASLHKCQSVRSAVNGSTFEARCSRQLSRGGTIYPSMTGRPQQKEFYMTENHRMGSNSRFTRREMLEMSSKAALAGIAAGTISHAAEKRPRIACVVTYWAAPGSHADWIITKLLDGYWWKGAHTASRVDVVSVYIHQLQESGLGQKVCKSKGIPIFNTVREALTLGGKELAVDGVVQVGEHG